MSNGCLKLCRAQTECKINLSKFGLPTAKYSLYVGWSIQKAMSHKRSSLAKSLWKCAQVLSKIRVWSFSAMLSLDWRFFNRLSNRWASPLRLLLLKMRVVVRLRKSTTLNLSTSAFSYDRSKLHLMKWKHQIFLSTPMSFWFEKTMIFSLLLGKVLFRNATRASALSVLFSTTNSPRLKATKLVRARENWRSLDKLGLRGQPNWKKNLLLLPKNDKI